MKNCTLYNQPLP